jgi:hypothetical protein
MAAYTCCGLLRQPKVAVEVEVHYKVSEGFSLTSVAVTTNADPRWSG